MSIGLLKKSADAQFKKAQASLRNEAQRHQDVIKQKKRMAAAAKKGPMTSIQRRDRNRRLEEKIMEMDFRNSFKGKKFTKVEEAEKEFKRKQRENHFKNRKIAIKKQDVDYTADNVSLRKKMKKDEKEATDGRG